MFGHRTKPLGTPGFAASAFAAASFLRKKGNDEQYRFIQGTSILKFQNGTCFHHVGSNFLHEAF